MPAKLKFHSWIQSGLSKGVANVADQLGNPGAGQAGVEVGLKISGIGKPFGQTVQLRGPGDVVGLDSAQIVRVEPKPDTEDFEPNFFPFVELVSPELPWLFTNAKAVSGGRLRPWLALIVLENSQDFEIKAPYLGANPVLIIRSSAGELLPDPKDAYAWCHVQESVLDGTAAGGLKQRLESLPEGFLARLVCPINLTGNSRYTAFLVPSFEAGRLAGLGMDVGDAGNDDAWDETTGRIELPVYHSWSFGTGDTDFEALVRRLKPHPVDETVGLHDLDIGHPRGGLNLGDLGEAFSRQSRMLVSFQGVLRSPIAAPRRWPRQHKERFQNGLERILTVKAGALKRDESYSALKHDPVVTPPLYGRWQSQTASFDSRKQLPRWMQELNLNPSERAVSGLATRIVRKHQEELMAEAWEHARNARNVHSELRQARLALHVGGRIHSRLSKLSDESWLQITSPMHKRVAAPQAARTLFASINRSQYLPSGVTDSAFRRFSSNQQKKLKSNADPSAAGNLARDVTKACVTGAPVVRRLAVETRSKFVSYDDADQAAGQSPGGDGSRVRRQGRRGTAGSPGRGFSETVPREAAGLQAAAAIAKRDELRRPVQVDVDLDLKSIAVDSRAKADPKSMLPELLFKRITGLTRPRPAAVPIPKDAMIELEFEEPVYHRLQALNPEFFLPGFGEIPNNTVSVLEPNASFIESYLLGLCHEMSREFAWREYPAKLNQTWFRRFWDYVDEAETKDIESVARWRRNSRLGSHAQGFRPKDETARTVLLIKGDLLRRYPSTIVYAARARWVEKEKIDNVKWERYEQLVGENVELWAREANLEVEEGLRFPVFMGEIGNDAHFLGFDLGVKEIYGSTNRAHDNPGWFFVFEQHMTEPKFGLDFPEAFSPDRAPRDINALSWGHFAGSQEELAVLRHLPLVTPWSRRAIGGVKWGENSAEMARLTYQSPVRIMFHADSLIARPG